MASQFAVLLFYSIVTLNLSLLCMPFGSYILSFFTDQCPNICPRQNSLDEHILMFSMVTAGDTLARKKKRKTEVQLHQQAPGCCLQLASLSSDTKIS